MKIPERKQTLSAEAQLQEMLGEYEKYRSGEQEGVVYKRVQTQDLSVKKLRMKLQLSQSEFSQIYGIPVKTIQHWELTEHKRGIPKKGVSDLFLRLISHHPVEMARLIEQEMLPNQQMSHNG